MESETELKDAELRLNDLTEIGSELSADLAAAVEAADAENMIRLQDLIQRNNIFRYAQKAKIIRLQKTADQQDRNVALYEKKILEEELREANARYEKAIREAEDKRVAMQIIQVKLFALESRIENDRQQIGERTKQLMEHIALWKQQAGQQQPEVTTL